MIKNYLTNKQKLFRFFCSCILFTSYVSMAQVRWHANPDSSTNVNTFFNRFDTAQSKTDGDCNPAGTAAASVGTVVDGDYGRVWRVRKPRGRQRAELARTNGTSSTFAHGSGEAFYYGWRFKISSDRNIASTDKVTVWQWKTEAPGGKQNYPLNFEYANGRLFLEAFGPCLNSSNRLNSAWNSCSGSISKRRTTLASVPVPEDTWVDIVLRIRKGAASGATGGDPGTGNGSVEFWFNGAKQTLSNSGADEYRATIINGKKANHRTNDGPFSQADNVYPKWGAYNGKACKYDITAYFDEMRVATTLEAASPATHNPVGSSSGGSATGITGSWYQLRNVATNRYMDGNGEDVATNSSGSGNDKQFRFIQQGSSYNIDIRKTSGTGTGIMRTVASQNRLKLTNLSPRNDGDKKYDVRRLSDGSYSIKSTNTDKFLQNNTSNTVTLTVRGPSGNNRAKWRLIRVGAAKSTVNQKTPLESESDILIYPNPVSDNFNIDLNNIESANITISSVLGKTVYSSKVTKSIVLSKSNGFASGIYVLRAVDNNGNTHIKKFIVK